MGKDAKTKAARVQVTCASGDFSKTCVELKKRGLKIDSALDAIQVVTGEIDPAKIPALKSVPGVTVEPEPTIQLPPPDAPVQ